MTDTKIVKKEEKVEVSAANIFALNVYLDTKNSPTNYLRVTRRDLEKHLAHIK